MITQQQYLAQNHEEILELAVKKHFSSVLIYKKLELEKFGVSLNSLDNYLQKNVYNTTSKTSTAHRVKNHRASIKGAIKPGETFNNWVMKEHLGYKIKNTDPVEFSSKRTRETGSVCYWIATCSKCKQDKEVNLSHVVNGRSKGCVDCRGK